MNFKATASSIAASGGIRPDSHITARPVTAIKAGSVALTLVAATLSIVLGGITVAIAWVIEGLLGGVPCVVTDRNNSDLSPSSTCPRGPLLETTCTLHDQKRLVSPVRRCGNAEITLTGQRNKTDERFGLVKPAGATSISGGHRMVRRKIGHPCAEKAGACRSRSIFSL